MSRRRVDRTWASVAVLAAVLWAPGASASSASASASASSGSSKKSASAARPSGKSASSPGKASAQVAAQRVKPSGRGKTAAIAAAASAAAPARQPARQVARRAVTAGPIQSADKAETRLIGVYELFGRGKSSAALASAEKLVKDYPNFQLAQLVYADLLAARVAPTRNSAHAVAAAKAGAGPALAELRDESQRRLQSLRDRPPPGTVPSQFLALSARTRYAIAVDASRSRLYLFQNTTDKGMQVVADYYISVGKAGIGKLVEGDARTPLGVYHVTSNLDPKSLRDFYGAGALPINYPNPYDVRRGRTGSGIWLHGTPSQQYARAPQATDGCVVMSNTDLRELLKRVEVGSTPVVIASSLKWITPQQAKDDLGTFSDVLHAWRDARTTGDASQLQRFYAADAQPALPKGMSLVSSSTPRSGNGVSAAAAAATKPVAARAIELKDVSFLHWKDSEDTMVVTFGEVREGEKTGRNRRQYWLRVGRDWKIFQEDLTG